MLLNMREILDQAREKRYCVAAPNVMDDRSAKAIIRAAERCNAPVILNISKAAIEDENFYHLASISAHYGRRTKIPVAVNLDHGRDYASCVQGVVSECTSIMADRSTLSFEENALQVAELTKIAHSVGKSIEAELGHVGHNVGAEKETDTSVLMHTEEEVKKGFTRPDEAEKYVSITGIDALAVAVGTVHGAYPKGMKPRLDFDLIRELREVVPVPLVVHGGSGMDLEDMGKIGAAGITKINLMADMVANGILYTSRFVDEMKGYDNLLHASTLKMKQFIDAFYQGFEDKIVEYLRILGCENKA